MKHVLQLATLSALLFTACKKDDTPPSNTPVNAALSLEFDNMAGAADLQLNTGEYTNASGEKLTLTKLKYYVSNFVLTNTDGTVYTVPQDSCYFLIDESDATTRQPLLKVPEGTYKTLSFVLGVDSVRSTKDISQRMGALDPTAAGGDMYWGWNSGYIFFKLEGTSPASTSMGGSFMYHIGGFGGYSSATINNIRTVSLDLTAKGSPTVQSGKTAKIRLVVDILKMFTGSTNVSLAANPMVMFSEYSVNIANNYTTMFRHDQTEN